MLDYNTFMTEKIFHSVEELFKKEAPDLLKKLECDDIFWAEIRGNAFADEELDAISERMEELGCDESSSDVARAVRIIQDARGRSLPTPYKFLVRS
jgi:ribosome assembly protein YihI (activator of Der GTPase)